MPKSSDPGPGGIEIAIDEVCERPDRDVLTLALHVLGVPDHSTEGVLARWEHAGRPTLERFAPYSAHVFKVDVLYYLGMDRGFISSERASNKADMAYLYYLPFCMIFTSGDNLHRRAAPLFLRADQSFVPATTLKAGLKELDDYYDHQPDEVKTLGVMAFAHYPPVELDNVVVQLWDKHMRPDWREHAKTPDQILVWSRELQQRKENAAELRTRLQGAQLVDDTIGEPDYIVIRRAVPHVKGKWRLVPNNVECEESDSV